MKSAKKGSKEEKSARTASYMRETASSLKKNRERVSTSCTPRRLANGGNSSACFDDYKMGRGCSVGPTSATSTSSNRRNITANARSKVPGYMQPTLSSSQKNLYEKYQIRPPPRPPSSAASTSSKTPTPKQDVKTAERRIQGSNVAMSAFAECLRRESGGSESSAFANNASGDIHCSPDAKDRNRVYGDRSRRVASVGYSNRNKESHRQKDTDKAVGPRFMQPTIVSAMRTYGRSRNN